MGDNMQYYKYILRNAANPHNRTVTFWPVSGWAAWRKEQREKKKAERKKS